MDLDHSVILLLIRLIFAGVLLVIASSLWHYLRRVRVVNNKKRTVKPPEAVQETAPEEIIILRLNALPGREFNAEDVYQRLEELNLVYNEGAFDYIDSKSKKVLFSVINRKKPNLLPEDPTRLRNFNGLIFIMRLPVGDGSQQNSYFSTLLAIVDELQKSFNANICNEDGGRLRTESIYRYQQIIEEFEKDYGAYLAEAYHQS